MIIKKPRPLTTSEVIRLLQSERPDKQVVVEGCDCAGDLIGISVDGDKVVLRRENGPYSYNDTALVGNVDEDWDDEEYEWVKK